MCRPGRSSASVSRLEEWWQRNQVLGDLLLAIAYVVTVIILSSLASRSLGYAPLQGWDIALTLLGVICLLARRTFPVLSLGVLVVFPIVLAVTFRLLDSTPSYPWLTMSADFAPFFIAFSAVGVLIYTTADLRGAWLTWLAVGGAIASKALEMWVVGLPMLTSGLVLSIYAMALTIPALSGVAVRLQRFRLAELEQSNARLVLERDQRSQLAVSQERTRIAREMHDVVAHSLAIIVTMADGAAANLERNPALARTAIEQLATTGRAALADTRRLVGVLRDDAPSPVQPPVTPLPETAPTSLSAPSAATTTASTGSRSATDAKSQSLQLADLTADPSVPLGPAPAARDITELVERFQNAGLPVTFARTGGALPDNDGLQLAVYRIVQESLTNILRYAPASPRISVQLARSTGTVEITVDNDAGAAGPSMPGSGKGILGMAERAAVYGGRVQAGPTQRGWRVHALMHWDEEEAGDTPWQLPT